MPVSINREQVIAGFRHMTQAPEMVPAPGALGGRGAADRLAVVLNPTFGTVERSHTSDAQVAGRPRTAGCWN